MNSSISAEVKYASAGLSASVKAEFSTASSTVTQSRSESEEYYEIDLEKPCYFYQVSIILHFKDDSTAQVGGGYVQRKQRLPNNERHHRVNVK